MFCEKCGKEVAEGTKFCPECGEKMSVTSEQTEKLSESPVVQVETPTTDQMGNSVENVTASSDAKAKFKFNKSKLIPSLIFGVVLSAITTFLISISFVRLFIMLGAWMIIGALTYLIVEAVTHSKVFAFLGAVIGALLLGSFLISSYYSAVESADTGLGLALIVAVVAVIYTPIVYLFASVENTPQNNDSQNPTGNNTK